MKTWKFSWRKSLCTICRDMFTRNEIFLLLLYNAIKENMSTVSGITVLLNLFEFEQKCGGLFTVRVFSSLTSNTILLFCQNLAVTQSVEYNILFWLYFFLVVRTNIAWRFRLGLVTSSKDKWYSLYSGFFLIQISKRHVKYL